MKKIAMCAAVAAFALVLASCGSRQHKKVEQVNFAPDSVLTAELEAQVDSLFALISAKLPTHPYIDIQSGKFVLTEQQKKVRPDYLLPLSKVDALQTLSQKNIALKMYVIDRAVAEMYGMDTNAYDAVIAELLAKVNVREFPFRDGIDWKSPDAPAIFLERTNAEIKEQKARGQLSYFVERVAASLIECSFLLSQAPDVYAPVLSEQDCDDLSYQLAIMTGIVNKMAIHYPMQPIREAMHVLQPLQAAQGKQRFFQHLKDVTPALKVTRNTLLD